MIASSSEAVGLAYLMFGLIAASLELWRRLWSLLEPGEPERLAGKLQLVTNKVS